MLAITSVVKDEIDVIEHFIDYHLNKGIEALFFYDNMSTDGTYEYLKQRAGNSDRIFVYLDSNPHHHQSKKMTELANIAHNHGFRYILPLDADELFVSDHSFRFHCEQIEGAGMARLDWKFYHPTEADDETEPNPFKRLTHTSGTQRNLGKSLIHWKPGMRIWQGNHGIDNPGQYMQFKMDDAYIANFPWRSREQAKKKIINNGLSHKNIKDNADQINFNYRSWMTGGDKWLDSFWNSVIIDSKELEKLPI